MAYVECFDFGVLMSSLKSTKTPDSKFSKMVRDFPAGKTSLQISHLITHICPSKQTRLIAQWVTMTGHPSQQVQLNSIPIICMH